MSDKCWVLLNDNGGQNMGNQSPYAPEFGLDGGAALVVVIDTRMMQLQ